MRNHCSFLAIKWIENHFSHSSKKQNIIFRWRQEENLALDSITFASTVREALILAWAHLRWHFSSNVKIVTIFELGATNPSFSNFEIFDHLNVLTKALSHHLFAGTYPGINLCMSKVITLSVYSNASWTPSPWCWSKSTYSTRLCFCRSLLMHSTMSLI